MSDASIQPVAKPFKATVTPPGSKSLSNRALVLGALADGASELNNFLFADDTEVMLESLQRLGFQLGIDRATQSVRIHGRAGAIESSRAELFCANSGTTTRFLTAMCTLGKGEFVIDGVPRMRQRPIRELVDLLRNLGTRVEYLDQEGFVPLRVHADGIPGGIARFGAASSSQYLSAAIMPAPYARNEVRIDLDPIQTSWPYVAMTMQLMDHFGCTPELIRDPKTSLPLRIIIPQQPYAAQNFAIEPDASNASYFLAAAAVNPGSKMTIEGLGKQSLQGDVAFADVLHKMGTDLVFGKDFLTMIGPPHLEGIDIDLGSMPDMAQTLAVVALFARGETVIHGLHNLRMKETDRLDAMERELTKLGAKVKVEDDALTIDPPENLNAADIDTYEDHRMAMSFAIACTRRNGIRIKGSECVSKTYPNFFEDFSKAIQSA